MELEVLGVDIGGVITDRVHNGTDTSFLSRNYLRTTPVAGAFRALRQLVGKRFGSQVFLVSGCTQEQEEKTKHWLDHHGFWRKTSIPSGNLFFCRQRSEKADVCSKLGVTHFVDDRLEVLLHLTRLKRIRGLYLFRPRPEEIKAHLQFLGRVRQVKTWQEIVDDLLA